MLELMVDVRARYATDAGFRFSILLPYVVEDSFNIYVNIYT